MRLIDADALIDWARDDMQMHIDEYHERKSIEQEKKRFLAIKNAVNHAPTIDAVPVVRCKDCVFSKPNDGKLVEGARYCSLKYDVAGLSYFDVWDNDYCSNAVERKNDETTANEDA